MNKREEISTDPEISFTVDEVLEWLERMALADGLLSDDEVNVIREFADFAGIDADEIIGRMRDNEKLAVRKVVAVSPNVIKGIEFENYVFDFLKKIERLSVISRSADYKLGIGHNMDERSLCLDFFVSQCVGKFRVRYWLECKYRSANYKFTLPVYQLHRFFDLQNEEGHPVFIVIGNCSQPSAPSKVYLIPLDDIIEGAVGYLCDENDEYELKVSDLSDYIIDLGNLDGCILRYVG